VASVIDASPRGGNCPEALLAELLVATGDGGKALKLLAVKGGAQQNRQGF
jgi:hypothetical protein